MIGFGLRLESGPGGRDVEDQLLQLKAEMGLIAPPSESSAPRQLEKGDNVQDAQVDEVSEEDAEQIPEAELLSEFDKLEGRQSSEG